jgi:hypothetical protein
MYGLPAPHRHSSGAFLLLFFVTGIFAPQRTLEVRAPDPNQVAYPGVGQTMRQAVGGVLAYAKLSSEIAHAEDVVSRRSLLLAFPARGNI